MLVDNGGWSPGTEEVYLSWEHGGKTPDQYTWEELQGLSDVQKEYFFVLHNNHS